MQSGGEENKTDKLNSKDKSVYLATPRQYEPRHLLM